MFQYAEPIPVNSVEECKFYHSIDLPDHAPIEGDWDLRETIKDYLGNYNFAGKKVLDVGTASGFLTFSMEKQGADVTSFDMARDGEWDIVPHYRVQPRIQDLLKNRRLGLERVKKSYWYSHNRLNSKAKVYYGNVYDFPEELGQFDVVLFGMILSHLRDPFQALYSASRLSTDTVIVVNQAMPSKDPIGYFMPNAEDEKLLWAWWAFSEGCLRRMLGVLGFEVKRTVTSKHASKYRDTPEECTAFIAQRVQ